MFGIKHDKSALDNFAEKYVIDRKPKITPFEYFKEKATQIKDFLRNDRNIKIRIIMTCLMEQQYLFIIKNIHNLQGYDSHLFSKQLAKVKGKLACIPSTEEKYISFSKRLRLININ